MLGISKPWSDWVFRSSKTIIPGQGGGVLRGLHYQVEPHAQGKLVRVVSGEVFDVAVDIRRWSPTYRWIGLESSCPRRITSSSGIPPVFAHGFLALTDPADVVYKVPEYYSPEHDRSIRWDDPDVGIDWPLHGDPIVSDKDVNAPYLRNAEVFESGGPAASAT